MDSICECLFGSFPNYTESMYDGNEPCGLGHRMIDGGMSDRWSCKFGSGETYQDRILFASFSVNHKVTVYIVGDTVTVTDNRHSGKTDEWIYCNNPDKMIHGCAKHLIHKLESEKLESILNSKFDSKFWIIIQNRAKELCAI